MKASDTLQTLLKLYKKKHGKSNIAETGGYY